MTVMFCFFISQKASEKKKNWRRKHEDFIQSIRTAREYTEAETTGIVQCRSLQYSIYRSTCGYIHTLSLHIYIYNPAGCILWIYYNAHACPLPCSGVEGLKSQAQFEFHSLLFTCLLLYSQPCRCQTPFSEALPA